MEAIKSVVQMLTIHQFSNGKNTHFTVENHAIWIG